MNGEAGFRVRRAGYDDVTMAVSKDLMPALLKIKMTARSPAPAAARPFRPSERGSGPETLRWVGPGLSKAELKRRPPQWSQIMVPANQGVPMRPKYIM